jgi:hypothetical protein
MKIIYYVVYYYIHAQLRIKMFLSYADFALTTLFMHCRRVSIE